MRKIALLTNVDKRNLLLVAAKLQLNWVVCLVLPTNDCKKAKHKAVNKSHAKSRKCFEKQLSQQQTKVCNPVTFSGSIPSISVMNCKHQKSRLVGFSQTRLSSCGREVSSKKREPQYGGPANTSAHFPTCPNCQISDTDTIWLLVIGSQLLM